MRMLKYLGLLWVVMAAAISVASPTHAHALQPGYLEVRKIDTGLYAVIWKVPVVSNRPMAISAVLPEACDTRSPGDPVWDGTAFVTRWTAKCTGGLEGGVIQIDGLDRTETDVLIRFDLADGTTQTQRLTADQTSFLVPSQPSQFEVVHTYLILGVEHILSGIDHLVFVLALLILVKGTRRLIVTITAFTAAHSLTLAGATLGFVHLPPPPIEAAIALSIAFVAAEIVHAHYGKTGMTQKYPWAIAFAFGLLHGFGFAGALTEIGLPPNSVPIALLFFNLGVEIGQLIFVFAVLVFLWIARAILKHITLPRLNWAWAVPPYLIGSLAMFWFAQRLSGF
jgi:hydrogenase/urease accessory protein HupE